MLYFVFVNALVVFIWKSRHTLYCVCWSDGGADRGRSLGVHRHAGEGERLDGSTNEEESSRESKRTC